MQIEPERYELQHLALDRRTFFKSLGLGLVVIGLVRGQESGGRRRRGGGNTRPQEIGAWLHIAEDGAITAFTGKAEVGQNTRTALIQGVAEELRVTPAAVKLIMGDTARVPFDAGTFGSRSMPDMLPQLRRVAAAARELLADEGARRLSAERTNMSVDDGWVRDSQSGQSLRYGEVVQGQTLLKTAKITNAALTPPDRWKVLGQPVHKVNGRDIVTGAHKYTPDIKVPGMVAGKPPRAASPVTGDATSETVYRLFKEKAEPRTESTKGSIEEGFKAAAHKLSATYNIAYIAHAPLEPRAAVAQWSGDKLTVWTGTQVPFGVKSELADALGIPEANVHVIVPDTGSGYGGKHTGDAAIEAAKLAKAEGKPVRVLWTREEEFTWAYFRPGGVIEVSSGVAADGRLTAWDFHNYNSGSSGLPTLYEVPHQRVHFHRTESPLRQGSYRGLAATANHFAREVHMDEIAKAVDKDPLEFRLMNLKDARLRAVLQAAAEKARWTSGSKVMGLAGGFEKGAYVASVAQVSPDGKRVERVVTAYECGAVVNPNALRNQIEGGVIMGLGGALTESIQFGGGRILNPRFSKYRVPRFLDIPVLETVLVDRRDLPSAGAGETPIVAVAPAISNAIFAATGSRRRSLPML